jgi:hypothetical protein
VLRERIAGFSKKIDLLIANEWTKCDQIMIKFKLIKRK